MARRGLVQRAAHLAAVFAVALLSLAYVQSVVMRAAPSSAGGETMAMCTSAGLAHVALDHGPSNHTSPNACPFCSAAAHAPLCALVAPIPQASVVAWTAYATVRPLGPRGPPAFEARARGPPHPQLTI